MNGKLYILGNGFDLMHGMHTSYEDFFSWLLSHNRYEAILELQSIFKKQIGKKYILWTDFETALGQYNFNDAADWDMRSLYITEVSAGDQLLATRAPFFLDVSINTIVSKVFKQWVQGIRIAKERKVALEKDSLYLTFNYTDTLENLYEVDSEKILHIHGRASMDEKLVFGHRHFVDPTLAARDDLFFRENNERIQHICDMNELYKPIEDILNRNRTFFSSICDVSKVEVIGHSFNEIDLPYFQKLASSVKYNADWKFNYHTDKDLKRLETMMNRINLFTSKLIKL